MSSAVFDRPVFRSPVPHIHAVVQAIKVVPLPRVGRVVRLGVRQAPDVNLGFVVRAPVGRQHPAPLDRVLVPGRPRLATLPTAMHQAARCTSPMVPRRERRRTVPTDPLGVPLAAGAREAHGAEDVPLAGLELHGLGGDCDDEREPAAACGAGIAYCEGGGALQVRLRAGVAQNQKRTRFAAVALAICR